MASWEEMYSACMLTKLNVAHRTLLRMTQSSLILASKEQNSDLRWSPWKLLSLQLHCREDLEAACFTVPS